MWVLVCLICLEKSDFHPRMHLVRHPKQPCGLRHLAGRDERPTWDGGGGSALWCGAAPAPWAAAGPASACAHRPVKRHWWYVPWEIPGTCICSVVGPHLRPSHVSLWWQHEAETMKEVCFGRCPKILPRKNVKSLVKEADGICRLLGTGSAWAFPERGRQVPAMAWSWGPPRRWQVWVPGRCLEVPVSFLAGVSYKVSEEHMYGNVTLNCSNWLWQPVLESGIGPPSILIPWLAHATGDKYGYGQGRNKGYERWQRARAWFPSENYCCHWLHCIIGMNYEYCELIQQQITKLRNNRKYDAHKPEQIARAVD